MGEIKKSLEEQIKSVAKKFLEESENENILVISHFDTDGISSATIMIKALKRIDKKFSIKILKGLEDTYIQSLPKDKLILFLDLASNSLKAIKEANLKKVFIIDHHEIIQKIPEEIEIINPELHTKQKLSSSSLVYLFCKELDEKNKDLAKLAVLGMVGDMLEKDIAKLNNHILDDGEIKKKRGLLIYPSTRPINKTLEYSSKPFIPGVTGDSQGVMELLREVGLTSKDGKFKSIIEMTDEEMERLVTAIMLRNPKAKYKEIIGDIFLIKLYNKLEDAREISAIVNACSRLEKSSLALQFLMEIPHAKKKAEPIHIKYRQHIIEGLKFANKTEKITGKGFIILNARENIKDTMIGTIASILSNSSLYEEGTIIVTMAYYETKIKVSARSVGKSGRNVREVLDKVIQQIGGQVGGHEFAAGCVLSQEKEKDFLELLTKNLEIEMIKI